MITTSENYINAANADLIYSRVAGTLTTTSGEIYTIDETNIIPYTLKITNKCLNNDEFGYGAVYSGQMDISLKIDNINRYDLFNAVIELNYYLRLEDGSEESVKLGTWIVSEPTRTKKVLALKCYDVMLNFDVDTILNVSGTVYDLLTYACNECGVVLGNTKEELEALPNGTITCYLFKDNVATYRDLIAYIAMITCTFATIDRSGELRFVGFAKTPVKTLSEKRVTASTVYDYTTYFSSVKARFMQNKNYATYSSESEDSSGLLLDMGDIPIVQGDPIYKHTVIDNIYKDLALINYTPVSINLVSDATLELGDMITIPNANGSGDAVNAIITSISFSHHGEMKIQSAGSNPKLQTASKMEKVISSLTNGREENNIVIFPYTNASEVELNQKDALIALIRFTSISETVVEFKASIIVNVQPENDTSELVITYKLNKIAITTHVPIATLLPGNHIITLYYILSDVQSNTLNRFEVYANVDNGTATIDIGQIIASISGQGLSVIEPSWNGMIEIEEAFKSINIHGINVAVENITEELLATVQSPVASLFAETFENIKVSGVNVSGFVDAIAVNPVTDKTTINTTTNNTSYSIYVSTDNAVFELDSSYTTSSEPVAIDTGYLTACNIDLTQFDEVQSVDVELVTYDYQTWNDVAECDYEELQEKTWLDVLRKES